MAKNFTQIVGTALVLVGLLGFVVGDGNSKLGLTFSTHHNLIHILSGAVLAYLGFKGSASSRAWAPRFSASSTGWSP